VIDPSKRFITVVLGLGVVVLLLAIFIGEHMGDRVLGSAIEQRTNAVQAIAITPGPAKSAMPYGPNWKSSQALAAAGDPGFPDPRIPPQPLPTPPKASPTPSPSPTPTINPNIPIWRQQPLPKTSARSALSPGPTATPVDGPSIAPP
jgi:hypothetical protein